METHLQCALVIVRAILNPIGLYITRTFIINVRVIIIIITLLVVTNAHYFCCFRQPSEMDLCAVTLSSTSDVTILAMNGCIKDENGNIF